MNRPLKNVYQLFFTKELKTKEWLNQDIQW